MDALGGSIPKYVTERSSRQPMDSVVWCELWEVGPSLSLRLVPLPMVEPIEISSPDAIGGWVEPRLFPFLITWFHRSAKN